MTSNSPQDRDFRFRIGEDLLAYIAVVADREKTSRASVLRQAILLHKQLVTVRSFKECEVAQWSSHQH